MSDLTGRQPCQCGCGRLARRGNRFLYGHKRAAHPVDRFVRHLDIASSTTYEGTACWVWMGSLKGPAGYGSFRTRTLHTGSRTITAHRFLYELWHGQPVPDGLVIDHLCRNRRCVNPLHIEAVTQRVNVLRGRGPSALNAKKTHCSAGHVYDTENTRVYRGQRHCRACDRVRQRRRRAEVKRAQPQCPQ
ncbi:HNH endonuclease signature motif containing protein [Mycobacterium sp. Z3061]|uniref:HNH endonuclease signature motif containing protein n=1 Tax=Mycobacterium sp. Z3061 TaxID=3073562 RepID=UPI002873D605|nr:HNH endonuclease signature motif containing protein [Mycobacterium sp. Z3061]